MRYHYCSTRPATSYYGKTYEFDHPVYNKCTLYLEGEKGLAVIQQYYDSYHKTTYWAEVNEWLVDVLYLQKGFKDYFDEHAGMPDNGEYPTVPLRKLMWALRMKPLSKQIWETTFDRAFV